MNKKFKALLIVLSLCLVIAPVTYASYLFLTTKGAVDKSFAEGDKSNLRSNKVDPAMDHVSILFLGIDDSESRRKNGQTADEARTDAMILATFNRDDKQIRLVSIPRDTLAYIPSVGYYDKITHAHAEGGPMSSVNAVEHLFNVPVDYYARINMQAFVDIINELGGIYFNVPFDIDEPTKLDKGRIKVKKGYQKINGDQALALVRSRHVDTDLGRGKRQMQMIEAIVKKAKETNSLSKLDELVAIVGDNAKHNLTFNNITSLASYYSSNDVTFKRRQLKGTDYMYDGVYYYNPVFDDVFSISNILRKDLQVKENKKTDLLSYKVIDLYDDLIPLKAIDIGDINKAYKEKHTKKKATESKAKKSKTTIKENVTTEARTSESATTEAPVIHAPSIPVAEPTTETYIPPTTESPRTYEIPTTERATNNYNNSSQSNNSNQSNNNSNRTTTTNNNSVITNSNDQNVTIPSSDNQ